MGIDSTRIRVEQPNDSDRAIEDTATRILVAIGVISESVYSTRISELDMYTGRRRQRVCLTRWTLQDSIVAIGAWVS